MKRSDDGRLIKIPDANAVAAAAGNVGVPLNVGPQNSGPQNSASIASVFPQRPSIIDMPQQPVGSNVPGPGVQHPIQAHRAGVTVYRGDPSGVVSSALPPAAHTGVVVTASPSPGVVPQQPPSTVMHGPPQSVVPQPATNIKPEPISKFELKSVSLCEFFLSKFEMIDIAFKIRMNNIVRIFVD